MKNTHHPEFYIHLNSDKSDNTTDDGMDSALVRLVVNVGNARLLI